MTVVIAVIRIIGEGFSTDDVLRQFLHVGLPVLLGLLVFTWLGPRRDTRWERALYPTIYAWLTWNVMDWLWDLSSYSILDRLFDHGIVIPLGFVVAYPVLWLLDAIWKPKPKGTADAKTPPAAK